MKQLSLGVALASLNVNSSLIMARLNEAATNQSHNALSNLDLNQAMENVAALVEGIEQVAQCLNDIAEERRARQGDGIYG